MINFKNFPEAIELADLLYQKLVEDGLIDLYDYALLPILEAKPEYGLRKIMAGAIQILMEKEDIERVMGEDGKNYTFTFKLKEV
jgi:hypothetical protein